MYLHIGVFNREVMGSNLVREKSDFFEYARVLKKILHVFKF